MVFALAITKDLYDIFFTPIIPVDFASPEESLHVMTDDKGTVVFVVMSLVTLACPKGGMHKSANRQIWFDKSTVSLRCFSRRCKSNWYAISIFWSVFPFGSNAGIPNSVVRTLAWSELYLSFLCDHENEDSFVVDILRSVVLSYF